MGFWGKSFTYDGTPCENFGLMVYNIGGTNQGDSPFASVVTPIEQTLPSRTRPVFLGAQFEEKLSFDIVFGIDLDRVDNHQYLDRHDMNAIATWLTGHTDYKWLTIEQEDLSTVRYRCLVTALVPVSFDTMPTAMRATFTCDGAFAYSEEEHNTAQVNGAVNITIDNWSALHGYYRPIIRYKPSNNTPLEICNVSDNATRTFQLSGFTANQLVEIDCENMMLNAISESAEAVLYKNCNFLFPRLIRGVNRLVVTGSGKIDIVCAYPINVGA